MKPKLLVLDNDKLTLTTLKKAFDESSLEISVKSDVDSALSCIRQKHPNVALLDFEISQKCGHEILKEAKSADPGLTVIITTGLNSMQTAIEVMKEGAFDLLSKPFDLVTVRRIVQKALENNLLNKRVRFTHHYSESDVDNNEDLMIGSTPEMMEIWKMIGKITESDAPVLITGESGTGKELLARAVYSNSKRRNRPFLAINCAAVPENLLESEFFGHEKGSFTDAHCRKIGKLEQCNGGTVFLDEIGEMSMASQSKLLRAIELQEFDRVGGNESIKVDIRVIAASNRFLQDAVKRNEFRLDLFNRLRVIDFHLPPLRERKADIPLFVKFFIVKYSRKNGKQINEISPEALEMLLENPWPGNIRELQNVINSAIILSNGHVLGTSDFAMLNSDEQHGNNLFQVEPHANFYEIFKKIMEPMFDAICKENKGKIYKDFNDAFEKALIRMMLAKCGHNQVLASKMLGISRNTLRSRIDQFNL